MTAESVATVLAGSRWIGTSLARAQIALRGGAPPEDVARTLYQSGRITLRKSREVVAGLANRDFTEFLEPRQKMGSAENPVTKLFPAAVTERQFLDALDSLREIRQSIDYRDERMVGHTLVDFTIIEGDKELPINVKNAGTRFEHAEALVGIAPDDCVPIPAYKAHDAVEKVPNLLYAISVDYNLIGKIQTELLPKFTSEESAVWGLLNKYAGSLIRDAEDTFIYTMVNKHWDSFSKHVDLPAFRAISARKSIRILQTNPKRTPGIGLRAWGTGASAEVNVHISLSSETKGWEEVSRRIQANGLGDIIAAVNRTKQEIVYDPEI